MVNRIEKSINQYTTKLKTIPKETKDGLEEKLTIEWSELVEFQKIQSTAFACGALSLDEAQTLFNLYGGDVPTVDKWDKLSLAEKIVGTTIIPELAKACKIL